MRDATYSLDSAGNLFRLLVFDHNKEPHSIVFDNRVLDDSNVYIAVPVNWVYFLVAVYQRTNSDGHVDLASFCNLVSANILSEYGPVIFSEINTDGKILYSLDTAKCFRFFDESLGKFEGAEIVDSECKTKWTRMDGSDADCGRGAAWLEILRDHVCDEMCIQYAEHLGLKPACSSLASAEKERLVGKKVGRISNFFKPLNTKMK